MTAPDPGLTDEALRRCLFDQNVEQHARIEAKHDGEHVAADRHCVWLDMEPDDAARCPICRESSATLLDPDYAPMEQVRAALELGGVDV
ncbi:hypothetical protein [Rhodococcus globerulus]|uniref:Uncharacterized protein n=1 Tax=Rhodococcus globerulus TaxID=33008 RepID=A0ABU4BSN9_RHOGO|nr:hypothetical protein [Rhodococcus globerulus]MDV6267053.1 hypothetical protein [Rhodococcus globerulus]